MNDYLINTMEVISLAPAGHHFDPKLIEPFVLDACEELRGRSCFGAEFYADIYSDLTASEPFDNCKVYTAGETVVFGAKYFECILDTTAGTLPTNATYWVEVAKFGTAKYQNLWDKYLGQYLTFSVLQFAVPSIALRATTMGVMKNNTDHSESATRDEAYTLKNDWNNGKDRRWNAMFNFLTYKTDDLSVNNPSLYPLFPANLEECRKDCGANESSINIPFV